MTRLQDLHRRLWRLKRRRQHFRWIVGYSALTTAALAGLGVMFLVDWLLQMDVSQRMVLIILWAAALIYAFNRYTRPWLGAKENELDMALLVERQQHIDSDLVAALQFESPDAPNWGSVDLEQAVIQAVITKGKRLNVMESLPRQEFRRRLQYLGMAALVWAILTAAVPLQVATFLNRLFLGPRHYPTRTHIDAIRVNHQTLDPVKLGQPPAEQTFWSILTARADTEEGKRAIKIRYGQAGRFEVIGSGELPTTGRVAVTALQSGLHATVELLAAPAKDQPPETDGEQSKIFVGELPKLVEAVDFQIFLGDAWTEAGRIDTTQLPVVDVELEVVAPAYANKALVNSRMPRGMRQVSVVEGSQVHVRVRSDKPLKNATIVLDEKEMKLEPQASTDPAEADRLWLLKIEGTPLEAVVQPVRYAVQVLDHEDQRLEKPIEGMVRILADLAPRIGAATNTPYVLPAAAPTIYYQAIDDHALGKIWLSYEVVRGEATTEDAPPLAAGDQTVYQFQDGQTPSRNLENAYVFDLGKLDLKDKGRLQKGDTIKVTLHAEDYRGGREPKVSSAEPVVFQVTDEQGILTSMLEADKHSARELKTMIQRQLGIGETQ